jgi:hypothetical protein
LISAERFFSRITLGSVSPLPIVIQRFFAVVVVALFPYAISLPQNDTRIEIQAFSDAADVTFRNTGMNNHPRLE